MSADKSDGIFEACLDYLNAKGYTLWGDYSLNPGEDGSGHYKNQAAARWLEAQVRGVADHYDTPANPAPPYAGPYSTETRGGSARRDEVPEWYGTRPSALITHGQQPETW